MAVITNIYQDHLNRYKNFSDYTAAKKPIFSHQNKKDILILNYDNPQTREFSSLTRSHVYFYSKKIIPKGRYKKFSCFLKNKEIFFDAEKKSVSGIKNLKLYGEHNVSNILGAVSVAKIFKVPSKNIREVLENFKGIPWRQEFIRQVKGVKYFNDTCATNPEAARMAIKTISQKFPNSKIILIAGGEDKNLNYKKLAKEVQKKINYLILLPGTASNKIKKELRNLNFLAKNKIFSTKSIKKAVKKASIIAKENNVVLLSPAAASFNLFKNEFDRGKQFNKAVKALT